MCGIMGYIGDKQAAPILLDGLSKLEYRGYDSAGLAVLQPDHIDISKCKGRLQALVDRTDEGRSISGDIGIGHTRWATHGEPSDVNSHPHLSQHGRFAVVHNGIIENYIEIKQALMRKGYTFQSDTDTEVVSNLVEDYYDGDLVGTLIRVMGRIRGSYALGILSLDSPDRFVAVRKESPLIVGLGENENYIASDIPALLRYTRDIYLLDDEEIALVERDKVTLYNIDHEEIQKDIFHVEWDVAAAEKGGYEHFMMKEIMEQPISIRETLRPRLREDHIVLDDVKLGREDIEAIDRVYVVACGSASYVGQLGKQLLENMSGLPVEVDIASEFRYRNPIVTEKTLVIIISQSGETADTLAALREAKRRGARTLAIVNVLGSSISREADDVLYTWAGPEIAVATTKAFSAQLSAFYLIALYFAQQTGRMEKEEITAYIAALLELPAQVERLLGQEKDLQHYAAMYFNQKDVFFIGRALDYALSMEGSLKLKEISYIHSEAIAAGELKHGTISLIEEGVLTVALLTQPELIEKMISNIREVKARGGLILAVATEGTELIGEVADHVFYVPKTLPKLMPSLALIPLQLFAYYMAIMKGCDVDKPRNLAKSVTVE